MPALGELTIGVLDGTDPQGRGLALRWARSGLRVVLGAPDPERATIVAKEINTQAATDTVQGMSTVDCAESADVVLVAVPWDSHAESLESLRNPLAGKIVVDCVTPLDADGTALRVAEGSAAEQAARLLPESTVTAAFHHVSAVLLADLNVPQVPTDVLVLGDDRAAVDLVRELAYRIPGCRGVYGGGLRDSHQVEAFAANLTAINKRYRSHAGIRVTDI